MWVHSRPQCSWLIGLGAAALLLASGIGAQEPPKPAATKPVRLEMDGPFDSKVRLQVFNRLRGEFADWFATPPNGPDSRYNFLGNKFQLGLRVTRQPYEVFVQFQDSTLANVPDNGVGIGAAYYNSTRRSLQNGTILRQAWGRTTRLLADGVFLQGGRMLYRSSLEAPARQAELLWVQKNRLSQRLIGPFDYTHVGRSFDGGQLGYDHELFKVTGFGFRPTFGGFEVDANRQLDITVGGISWNLKDSPRVGNTIAQLFWFYYGDNRDVVYTDNRPLPVRQKEKGESANIHTVGASAVHVLAIGPGLADGMVYSFGQFGDWQSQNMRAWAYGVEAGYRLVHIWARPWIRFGINSASGDNNPDDDLHETFFQMLPTAWLYAQFPFYNMMNNQDVFVQWILDPHRMVDFRLDLHWLRANTGKDFVYFGGGATKNDTFGYGGTNARGRNNLACTVLFMLTVKPTHFLKFNGFYSHAFGQGIINANFAGTAGNYGFLEAIVSF